MDEHIEEFIYTKGKLTQEHYNIDLSHFRKWLRANTASVIQEDVTEIRLLHAQRYLKTLPDTPAKRRRIIALRSFFHHLYVNDHIPKNTFKVVESTTTAALPC
jgi:site-specific recombinase XerD